MIIDTAPANHTYTGGCLGNLAQVTSRHTPDYLCGEFTWDGSHRYLNWYHWQGASWRRTRITDNTGIAVGMGIADLTGTGTGDIVATEWRLGPRSKEDEPGHIYWFEQPADPFNGPWPRHVLASGWEKTHDLLIGDLGGLGNVDVLVRMKDGRMSWFEAPADDPRQP